MGTLNLICNPIFAMWVILALNPRFRNRLTGCHGINELSCKSRLADLNALGYIILEVHFNTTSEHLAQILQDNPQAVF